MEAGNARGARSSLFAAFGIFCGVFGLALLLRLSAIHDKFLWFDEFLTANLARNSWSRILGAVRAEAHPPLYFVGMKVWGSFFGDGPVALKTVSLLCGMAALGFLADAVRRVFGSVGAIVAALLFGLSTVQIDQSTDAKPYALLVLLVVLQIWALVRAGAEPERRGFFALAVLCTLAGGSTHFYGTAAVLAVGLAALLSAGDARGRGRGSAILLAGAAAALAWTPAALRLPRGAADYIREIWGGVPRWAPILVSTRISLPGWRKPYPPMAGTILPQLSAREIVSALLVVVLLAWGSARGRGSSENTRGERFLTLAGSFLLFGFLLLETAALFADRPIGLPGRLEVITETGLALLAARAAFRAGPPARVLGALLAAACVWTVVPQWRPRFGPRPTRREQLILRDVRGRLAPGQSADVVTLGLARPPLEYYAAGDSRVRLVSFPASQQQHPGWREGAVTADDARSLRAEAAVLVPFLDSEIAHGVTVYIAAREDPRNAFLLPLLERDHELIRSPLADWFYILVSAPVRLARAGNLMPAPVSHEAKEALWDDDGSGLPVF